MKRIAFNPIATASTLVTLIGTCAVFGAFETSTAFAESKTEALVGRQPGTPDSGRLAPDRNPDMATAWHEFHVFGRSSQYIFHKAVFHSIHNFFALAKVTLDYTALQAYVAAIAAKDPAGKGTRLTLSPTDPHKHSGSVDQRLEDWKLPQYIFPKVAFNADLHNDDYEHPIASNAKVKIDSVVAFKSFEESEPVGRELTYVLFGSPDEAYLAYDTKHFPDIQQIIAVSITTPDGKPLAKFPSPTVARGERKYTVVAPHVVISGRPAVTGDVKTRKDDTAPLAVGDEVTALLSETDTAVTVKVTGTILAPANVNREF